jgi:hypothetical protein
MKECTVCLVPHDEEIHAATLNVRRWFHQQVTQGFYDDPEVQEPQATEPEKVVA